MNNLTYEFIYFLFFQIEKRTKYGRWEPAICVGGDVTATTVPNLIENEQYEFRVIAGECW